VTGAPEPADELGRRYLALQQSLPAGWLLDGVRCASSGLEPDQRSDAWQAVARAADGVSITGSGLTAFAALDDLQARVRSGTLAPSAEG
jgi:hypothetical protein